MPGPADVPSLVGMATGTTYDHDPQTHHDDGPRLRASDAERAATVEVLKDAVTHGLLDLDEGGKPRAPPFAARYRDELPAITADLPPLPVVTTAVGWRSIGSSVVAQL